MPQPEMMERRLRVCLATDSLRPSGVGTHMLLLAEEFSEVLDVVIAADPASGLLEAAAQRGLAIRAITDPADFAAWLQTAGIDILHIHAGIGWEGHDLARIGREAGVATLLRTEHLPYVITDAEQAKAHAEGLTLVDRLIAVSEAAADSFRIAGLADTRLATIPNGVAPRPVVRGSR